VALKRTGCDAWQLECQANNVTASVQNDRFLHKYMLSIFFDTDQSRSTPRCAEIQPTLQQATAASLNMSINTRAPRYHSDEHFSDLLPTRWRQNQLA